MSLISAAMDGSGISFSPKEYSDFSTGYLEDDLIEFTSKRSCLVPCPDEQQKKSNSIYDFEMSSWNVNFNPIWIQQPVEKFHCMNHMERIFSLSVSGDEMRKKNDITTKRAVYPFALVKPGDREGDLTLNDINERILMPPTRAVRHPVGDFACKPCVSVQASSLSGKVAVTLIRIHTFGRRGTITIIRTKG